MADSRNNRNSYRTVYVNDNLARKQEAYIETTSPRKRETVTQQPEKQDLHKAHTKANHGLSSSFGFAFTLVMAGVMVGIFIVLTKYISLNINMTQKAREIASLRKELSTMTMENDNLEISINSSIDYDLEWFIHRAVRLSAMTVRTVSMLSSIRMWSRYNYEQQ